MAYTSYTNVRTASAITGAYDFYTQMASAITERRKARSTRAALNGLSEHALEDIGLSRGDIESVATQGHR